MKRTLAENQLSFFKKGGFLVIDHLLDGALCDELNRRLQKRAFFINSSGIAAANRIPDEFMKEAQKSGSSNGRDLWQTDPLFKKVAMDKVYSHIARALFDVPLVRLAFDQVLFAKSSPFRGQASLNSLCSFQSLLGALIVRLSDSTSERAPSGKGAGMFVSAQFPFDWDALLAAPGDLFWVLGYCPAVTLYVYNPSDPLTHLLKRAGYGFGDRLRDDRHPPLR